MPTYNFKTNRELEIDGVVKDTFEGPVVVSPRIGASTFTVWTLDNSNLYYYSGNNTFEIDGVEFVGTLQEFSDELNTLYQEASSGGGAAYPDITDNDVIAIAADKFLSINTAAGEGLLRLGSDLGASTATKITIGQEETSGDDAAFMYIEKYTGGSGAAIYSQILGDEGDSVVNVESYAGGGASYQVTVTQDAVQCRMNISSVATAFTGPVTLSTSTPASASATGTAGTITWDASYIYICTATNTWKRVAIATW